MSNATETFRTSADTAYEIICSSILSGTLPPGTKLSRRKMAELTGVSIIPVIEALHRLEDEGLVESKPQWGSRVITLTPETIQDRFALREAIECQVVRILCKRATEKEIGELYAMAQELDDYENEQKIDDEFWDVHYRFHLRMAQMTGHKSLEQALHRINLFHLLQRAEMTAHQRELSIPEDNHRRIVRTIEAGDCDRAEAEMREHIFHSGVATRED